MLPSILFYVLINVFCFIPFLYVTSFLINYKININLRTFITAVLTNIGVFFFFLLFFKINIQFYLISTIIFFFLFLLFNIYVPILIDRSFTIEIFMKFEDNKEITHKDLNESFQKNFFFFIERRISYLMSKNYLEKHDMNLRLKRRGKIIKNIYKFFKKIYRI